MAEVLNSSEQAWCDDLLLRLRLQEVPGTRIGEVLAEVQSHVAETGEHPQAAFGTPKAYAAEIVAALGIVPAGTWATLRHGLTWRDAVVTIAVGLAAFALADGLWSLGAGTTSLFGRPAWAVCSVGALVLTACTARFVITARREPAGDPVLDPRTGADMTPFSAWRLAVLAGLPVVFLALAAVGGTLAR
jgi:hypothetical protein